MARTHARLLCSVWDDVDYRSMGLELQGLFNALLAYPKISWCGVIDYMPRRLMRIDPALTEESLWEKLARLHNYRAIQIDTDTDELLVRTFVKHDGVMKHPNVAKAMGKAIGEMESELLRDVLMHELGKLYIEEPGLEWDTLKSGFGDILHDIETAAVDLTDLSRKLSTR